VTPEAMRELEALRQRIDALDEQVLALVAERARVVASIAALKRAEGVPLKDPAREREILGRLQARRPDPLTEETVAALLQAILGACLPAAR
jgi:chorismate mutase/prephenate dehydratase